ncbi:MAG: hypothetical protein IJJ70_07335 [Treponema sp.]|jgi:hypothetical protein|nr:hypothetical protein [Treponema sp.]MBR0487493.1 hypothetical protein [Treponema sp.]
MEQMVQVKNEILNLMNSESDLLDQILAQQDVVHKCVKKRNWIELEATLQNLQVMSDDFVELETKRSQLSANIDIFADESLSPVVKTVRGKLNKSKIENKVLNEYISTTKKFLQGIFDDVLPQRRNAVYSRNGKMVDNGLQSVVLNQVV